MPYLNAAPHLGHALELVQADVLARHRRLRGREVRFLSGTDDNALKNVTAAAAAGAGVAEFVAAGAERFAELRDVLELSFDDFLRTYDGAYCHGCEAFYEAAEAPHGRCPEHGTELERVVESNCFFRLSAHATAVLEALESGRVRVEPATRLNEVLAFVRGGLQDISVS
ncbi:class I tRNA ligase family protein [Motilibacter peucedani]|uniref:class I tRNA ligase family protein n=1 Tax=Motilibacter peucedani TaxID=598650 RepID=UPI001E34651D